MPQFPKKTLILLISSGIIRRKVRKTSNNSETAVRRRERARQSFGCFFTSIPNTTYSKKRSTGFERYARTSPMITGIRISLILCRNPPIVALLAMIYATTPNSNSRIRDSPTTRILVRRTCFWASVSGAAFSSAGICGFTCVSFCVAMVTSSLF